MGIRWGPTDKAIGRPKPGKHFPKPKAPKLGIKKGTKGY